MNEINRLMGLLKDNNIEYEIRPHELFKNAQLFYPNKRHRVLDVVIIPKELCFSKGEKLEVLVGEPLSGEVYSEVDAEKALEIIKKNLI